ncbi:MAG: PTS system mannose/fructose/sorbose family transporter subunit IID [Elusimicrobiota bacterium]|jgi:PTS system mannose-specific IID component|nr:PTS system mannose/fructose/sorbose family transporter subunit IID [Elusimicrobiota bacterium]
MKRFSIFLRTFLIQGFWNFSQMQNLGALFVMDTTLKRLYKPGSDAYLRALVRNMETFNTNPVMSSYSIGAMIRQEEVLASSKKEDFEEQEREWRIIRATTANTAASIGDRLFWATLKPLSLVFCILVLFASEIQVIHEEIYKGEMLLKVFLAVLAALLVYNIPSIAVRLRGLKDSYQGNEENFYGLINLNWNKAITFLKTLGQIFTVFIIFYGIYIVFGNSSLNPDSIARMSLLVAFIILSIFMKKLNIPNIFLYIIAAIVFGIASFLA